MKTNPKRTQNEPNRRALAGNPKLEILSSYVKTTADKNPTFILRSITTENGQIRMNEIQRYKTRFFAEFTRQTCGGFILEQSKGLEMTTKWISAHRETILCKTKPILRLRSGHVSNTF
ncbi:MAG: hypothetical protein ACYTBX_11635 [Planctomycetota bacterium]